MNWNDGSENLTKSNELKMNEFQGAAKFVGPLYYLQQDLKCEGFEGNSFEYEMINLLNCLGMKGWELIHLEQSEGTKTIKALGDLSIDLKKSMKNLDLHSWQYIFKRKSP